MANKLTKKEGFKQLREIVEGVEVDNKAELVEMLDKQIEQLDNRKRTETKAQKANKEFVEVIYAILADNEKGMTIADIQAVAEGEVATFSSQKMSALMKKIVDAGRATKATNKEKKSVYTVVAE